MKKIFLKASVLVCLSVMFSGCNVNSKTYKVGVLEQASCTELDEAYEGFLEGLSEAGYKDGENIKIDFYDCENDLSKRDKYATKLVFDKKDLIFALSGGAAEAVAQKTQDIPIVATAVTDFEKSSLTAANITGTSDSIPVEEQISLLHEMLPQAGNVAIVYNNNDENSVAQANRAAVKCKEFGIVYSFKPITYEGDAEQDMYNIIGAYDAIYIPSDPIVYNCMDVIKQFCEKARMPVIVGDEGMLEKYGLATVVVDYKELGKISGNMAAKVLEGTSPSELEVSRNTSYKLIVSEECKQAIGLESSIVSGSYAPVESLAEQEEEEALEEQSGTDAVTQETTQETTQ